ncbi:dUMP phosphatase [Frateuria sp. Soil773]|uniref:pyrimidine 5'-nucleotidase n=1 Tax=Frateuria sp. Soil773 TaxID=1736407 RepID=UPI0006F99250|nr:pyrimidine 5'-nucleotidase [Frateuria sp. Soil773]KRE92511.1 dUMP phosphatase [Frateuria sp. Soil773]
MDYPWILFDADDTLFHFDAYRGLRLMFSAFGVDFTAQDFEHYQQANKPLWTDYQDGRINAGHLQVTRFASWADRLGVAPQRLNSAFLAAMADICTLLPGAEDLIRNLRGRARLGLVTNGFTELQTARLERTGLKDAFSPLVISEQVGIAKPDARIFAHALALMGEPPRGQVLMVGDNPHSDILGGLNAGIRTCWFNPRGEAAPPGIEPHHQVDSLAALQRLLLS